VVRLAPQMRHTFTLRPIPSIYHAFFPRLAPPKVQDGRLWTPEGHVQALHRRLKSPSPKWE